jgi:FKBP-type peptidyl-prolyl cis-trans isomerases 1
MKKFSILAFVAVVAGIAFSSCDSKKSGSSVKLVTGMDSVSYILGKAQTHFTIKQSKEQMKMQLESGTPKGNYEAFLAGVNDALNNLEDTLFLGKSQAELNEYINGAVMQAQEKEAQITREETDKFLAANKTKSGILITESGLQYKIITEGTGAKPKAGDRVKVHYTGKLFDGTEFDSSITRGEPAEFPLVSGEGGVIQGWVEGLQLMPVGSKYVIWIPTDLGYGMNTRDPNVIPFNSGLEFEIELLEIVK